MALGSSGTYRPWKDVDMASVRFVEATCIYPGSDVPAIDSLNLTIEDGEFMVLVGPSGCGKSTALRMLAGLEEVTSGKIYLGDIDITHLPAKQRDVAMVFQNYALYPHMTAAENMGFALKMLGVSNEEQESRVYEAAKLLGLEDYLDRKPKSLSGGQRQRVAMGRAIVRRPEVFLMDEPLSNLDSRMRIITRNQVAALQQKLRTTTLYVTHDQVEAMTLGHRVAVLNEGVLQQVDTPLALYDHPVNLFVASFFGTPPINIVKAKIVAGGVDVGGTLFPLSRQILAQARQESHLILGIRAEDLRPAEQGLEMTITSVDFTGSDTYVTGTVPGNIPLVARVPRGNYRRGDRITVAADKLHVFSARTEMRLT